MADRILFIGWGAPVRGREERGLEVFDEAVGFYGRCQQDGRIEAFNVILLEPHGGGLKAFGDDSGALGDLPGAVHVSTPRASDLGGAVLPKVVRRALDAARMLSPPHHATTSPPAW
jgi:hypothetical protein